MAPLAPRVLLAEDDPFMSALLSQELAKEGFEVSLVVNGEEAVERFRNERPDAMVIDVLLPRKNGLEALREIRALPGGLDIPAIILSNMEEAGYIHAAEQLGVKAYLVKANTQLPEIVAKVREALAAT